MRISFVIVFILTTFTYAEVFIFTDQTDFLNELDSFETHNFDNFPANPFNSGPLLTDEIPGITFENARVTRGENGGTFESPENVLINADLANPIIINFDSSVNAVGLFNTSLVDAERFEIFGAEDNLLGSIDLPDQAVNFGGFISDEIIARAVITPIAPTNGSIFIDTLTVSAVPEPSTYAILLLSLFTVSYFRKKK